MREAIDFARAREEHVTLLIGVVAEHDSAMAADVLDELTAILMSQRWMPLLPTSLKDDCLVAPPERMGVHLEIRWIQV